MAAKKLGRPPALTSEKMEKVCTLIADGYSLRQIGAMEGMPAKTIIMRGLADSGFRDQYARARELQAEHFADEILEIADDGTNDWVERERKDGSTEIGLDHEHVMRSKLRIEARRWLMGKMAPKKYGDQVQIEHSGGVTISEDDRAILRRHAPEYIETKSHRG